MEDWLPINRGVNYTGVWVEGSAFRLQIEIKGFEFPGLLKL